MQRRGINMSWNDILKKDLESSIESVILYLEDAAEQPHYYKELLQTVCFKAAKALRKFSE